MKGLIKGSFKVTISYLASIFLFSFFLIGPLSMENNAYTWVSVLSFIMFMFLWSFMVIQLRKLGVYEKKETTLIKAYPFKGLVYGVIGFSPFILIEIIYFIVYSPDKGIAMRFFHAIFRCLFGPMYFIIRGLNYTWYAHLIATITIPLIALVGYFIGYYDISLRELKNKSKDDSFLDD